MADRGLYQRGDTWCIRYTHNGKRVRKAIGTKGEARKELTAIRARIDNRTFVPPREDSFDALVDEYEGIQEKKAGYATEKYHIARIRDYFKGRTVQDIGVEDVERFQAYLTALPKRTGGTRGSSDINHHMGSLYSILKKAVLRDWIVKNPAAAERVERVPKNDGRKQYLKVEEVRLLLNVCPPHLYSIVLCMVSTGMRPGEALRLKWSEIQKVTLRDGTPARIICLPAERTKTRKGRRVPVHPLLAAHLDALKEAQTSSRVVSFSDLVFRSPQARKGRRKDARRPHLVTGPLKGVRRAWATALEKAELDPTLHLHDLRRTFRSHMKMAGVDSFTLNEIIGHANPAIEKVYTQIDDEHLCRTIERLPEWHKTTTSCGPQHEVVTL